MQYSIATAITTILFASSAYAAAIPQATTSAQDINIQCKTGDGDSSVQKTIALNGLTTEQTNGSPLGAAVNAVIVDSGFTCQVFSDANGLTKLGGAFDSVTPASFTDESDGGVSSDISSAVTLGSICCAPTAQFEGICASKGNKAAGNQNKNNQNKNKNGNNNRNGNGNANNKAFPVRIQIGGLSEQATQGEILANGKPQPLKAPLIGEDAISVSIVRSEKPVQCTAFGDLRGKRVLGRFNEAADASFKPSDIESVACTLSQ